MATEREAIRMVMTHPSVNVIVIDQVMLEEARQILKIPFADSEMKQLIGYDTTFNVGDFYVSYITFRDVTKVSKRTGTAPVFNLATIIHSTKFQMMHRFSWEIITELVPELKNKFHVAVADDEFGDLLRQYMPKSHVAACEVCKYAQLEYLSW